MKFIRTGKQRVFVFTAGILVISLAVLITSVQVAMGAEEGRSIEEPATVAALATVEPMQAGGDVIVAQPGATGNNVIAAQPGPELITEQQAVESCLKVAADVFDLSVDSSSLTVTFEGNEDIIDENGVVVSTTHDIWSIVGLDFSCAIDAASGGIIVFYITSEEYPGSSITEGIFSTVGNISAPDGGQANMHNSPDNIYIKAAVQLVNERLANGRVIDDIQIDGVQFVWDDNDAGFDPDATGTMQVDCHVLMEKGPNYTLSFWGTDEIVLKIFSSHPTQHACLWGYYYEEDGSDYPPEG